MLQTRFICLFLLTFIVVDSLSAQLSDASEISLLTCRRGDDIYNMYGHTAIRITDPAVRMDQVYNYGVFSFSEPGFLMKFLRGKLLYRLEKSSYTRFTRNYIPSDRYGVARGRSIIAQTLNLTTAEKNKIYQALETNCLPANKSYYYDFFFDNCSTRCRDLFRNELSGISYPSGSEHPHTFRTLLDVYTEVWPFTDLGQDLIVGSVADQIAGVEGEMFLPEFLQSVLDRTTLNHQPFVKETKLLLDYEDLETTRGEKPWPWPVIIFSLLLILEFLRFIKRERWSEYKWWRRLDSLWYLILGIGGLIIVFMWFGTDHLATKKNLNLLWMSPFFMMYAFNRSRSLGYLLASMMIAAILLSPMIQSLHPVVLMIIGITLLKICRHTLVARKT